MSGTVDYDTESGKCAYDVYSKAVAKEGEAKAPPWDKLSPQLQIAWIAAARAVAERENRRKTQF
jgi:hypothetical protein